MKADRRVLWYLPNETKGVTLTDIDDVWLYSIASFAEPPPRSCALGRPTTGC